MKIDGFFIIISQKDKHCINVYSILDVYMLFTALYIHVLTHTCKKHVYRILYAVRCYGSEWVFVPKMALELVSTHTLSIVYC